jgi:hypothetical protein
MQFTHSLKAPGFNPRAYEVKKRFQAFAFKCSLYRYIAAEKETAAEKAATDARIAAKATAAEAEAAEASVPENGDDDESLDRGRSGGKRVIHGQFETGDTPSEPAADPVSSPGDIARPSDDAPPTSRAAAKFHDETPPLEPLFVEPAGNPAAAAAPLSPAKPATQPNPNAAASASAPSAILAAAGAVMPATGRHKPTPGAVRGKVGGGCVGKVGGELPTQPIAGTSSPVVVLHAAAAPPRDETLASSPVDDGEEEAEAQGDEEQEAEEVEAGVSARGRKVKKGEEEEDAAKTAAVGLYAS